MHPQLAEIAAEFDAATARLQSLAGRVPDPRWGQRADPARWSIGECIAHLNLTSEAYLPILDDAVARACAAGGPVAPGHRYARGITGWILWKTMGPPVRVRVRTAAPFVPSGDLPRDEVVAGFERLQARQLEYLRAADGLPLERVRVASPFSARVTYNLYACLSILPRHQHRHLWQAEQVAAALA